MTSLQSQFMHLQGLHLQYLFSHSSFFINYILLFYFTKKTLFYFDFTFKMEYLKMLSVFDAVNYILICFPQIDPNEAYIHFLVEDICEFSKNKTG